MTHASWDQRLLRNPHAVSDKRSRVQRMFAAIAPSYDLNNRLHSLWMDQLWRRKAVRLAQLARDDRLLDVACGTGDLTLKLSRFVRRLRGTAPEKLQVLGVDFTFEMLPLARHKANSARIAFVNGDAQALPLADESVDVVCIAFGIRNVVNPTAAINEFVRVLRPGGRLVILEFSLPTNPVLRALYNLYFRRILPVTATWISHDRTGAYRYLPESVNTFIGRLQMQQMMEAAGLGHVEQFPMTCGVAVCYRGIKSSVASERKRP